MTTDQERQVHDLAAARARRQARAVASREIAWDGFRAAVRAHREQAHARGRACTCHAPADATDGTAREDTR